MRSSSARAKRKEPLVRLAMQHLRDKVGDKPIHVIGYSNGGALAVQHALAALEDASLPQAERLVLISPEIGISRVAALARLRLPQRRAPRARPAQPGPRPPPSTPTPQPIPG